MRYNNGKVKKDRERVLIEDFFEICDINITLDNLCLREIVGEFFGFGGFDSRASGHGRN